VGSRYVGLIAPVVASVCVVGWRAARYPGAVVDVSGDGRDVALAPEPRRRPSVNMRSPPQHAMAPGQAATEATITGETLSVREAATLLGRDRTRVYALIRSGDLAVVADAAADSTALRIDRSSVERWAAAGGSSGRPLTAGHAWALIAVASGNAALRDRCLGLLERPEEVSRVRAPLAGHGLLDLAPRLRRRASVTVLHLPPPLLAALGGSCQPF